MNTYFRALTPLIRSSLQTAAPLMVALFLSACSGGNSSAGATVSEIENMVQQGGNSSDVSSAQQINNSSDTATDQQVNNSSNAASDQQVNNSSNAASDQQVSNLTEVTFDINVPAYMSNNLQVRLVWGDIDTTASWVIDESWIVVDNLPTNTTNTLTVFFSDNNGLVTLASFESVFETGTGLSDTYQISADQFETEVWDDDGDGVSNINELISTIATEPVSNSTTLQPVQTEIAFVQDKTIRISWQPTEDATVYRVFENPDGLSGFSQISEDLSSSVQSFDQRVALYEKINASYIVQSCNASGCVDSDELVVSGNLVDAIGYFKASNTEFERNFGDTVSLSRDGSTLAVGASGRGDVGGESDSVYIFAYSNDMWLFQAVLRSNTDDGNTARFGSDISLNSDGNVIAVGEIVENTVYVFERNGGTWEQTNLLQSSNADVNDFFGSAVSMDASGDWLAVAAEREDSSATGINGDQADDSAFDSGAVYIFKRTNGSWQQQAYLKASNTDSVDFFGSAVSLSQDSNTLAVGAWLEDSASAGVNADENDNTIRNSGAVYIFKRDNDVWQQQAYLKPSNTSVAQAFGASVSLSFNGDTLAVGASGDDSATTGVNGDQNVNTFGSTNSGAVFIFSRTNETWQQQAFLKASNPGQFDSFGSSVSLSADGNILAVGSPGEDSDVTGFGEPEIYNGTTRKSGAVYVYKRDNVDWQLSTYVKASNTGDADRFGGAVSLSLDGQTLAVGANGEDSAATGVNADQNDNTEPDAGAVYLY